MATVGSSVMLSDMTVTVAFCRGCKETPGMLLRCCHRHRPRWAATRQLQQHASSARNSGVGSQKVGSQLKWVLGYIATRVIATRVEQSILSATYTKQLDHTYA